jgi:hypothetical protein
LPHWGKKYGEMRVDEKRKICRKEREDEIKKLGRREHG